MCVMAPVQDLAADTRRTLLRRWLIFNLVGWVGIPVQLGMLAALTGLLEWNYLAATAAAVEAAVLHNFVWHERWTWSERAGGGVAAMFGRLGRFHLANGALSLLGNVLLMKFFVGQLAMNCTVANLTAIVICSILNFFAGDRLVFVVKPPMQAGER